MTKHICAMYKHIFSIIYYQICYTSNASVLQFIYMWQSDIYATIYFKKWTWEKATECAFYEAGDKADEQSKGKPEIVSNIRSNWCADVVVTDGDLFQVLSRTLFTLFCTEKW